VRRLVALLPLAVAACAAGDPCAGVAGTCLAVHVASPSAHELDELAVDVTAGAFHDAATTRPSGGRATLPLTTAIELAAVVTRSLEVRVALVGKLDGNVVGVGAAAITLDLGQHAAVQIVLGAAPADGGAADAAPDAAPDAGCVPGGLYCGGDKLDGDPQTLYRCNADAAPTARGRCSAGCILIKGNDDRCNAAGGMCTSGGSYCGGDKLEGDPMTLYRCGSNGSGTVLRECAKGCMVNPPGQDDACR